MKISLKDVKVEKRMRGDLGDLSGLKDSISRHGLLCPIVLDPNNVLIAGERRYRAHCELGLESIDFITRQEMSEDQKAELEFEENFWRKAFSWQEEALGILNIYRKKRQAGALAGFEEYYQQIIAEMFAMSIGKINYILKVAKKLEEDLKKPNDQRRYWNFSSVNEAYRLGILAEEEDRECQLLAKQQQSATPQQEQHAHRLITEVEEVKAKPELLQAERERYASNPLNVVPFETYWAEKQSRAEELKNTIYLSNTLIQGDCITWMNDHENSVDHIITDPPYAIDMDMLNQQNSNGGLVDLDRVVDAHQVDENRTLLSRFFPAAFKTTREKGFVIICGDIMLWQYCYDLALAAGFVVQRWPFIWRKVNQSTMNNCPGYNTTKDFEIAMICRKPGATLAKKWNTSFQDASNVEVTKLTGHPFAKPFELTRAFVEMATLENQLILEPFAGGGSMIMEMLRSKRRVIGIEKETHHYNVLLENIKQFYLKQNPKFTFK